MQGARWMVIFPSLWVTGAQAITYSDNKFDTPITASQGATQPPARLSERDLIAAMERHGIGTDATVAEHIQKQLDR